MVTFWPSGPAKQTRLNKEFLMTASIISLLSHHIRASVFITSQSDIFKNISSRHLHFYLVFLNSWIIFDVYGYICLQVFLFLLQACLMVYLKPVFSAEADIDTFLTTSQKTHTSISAKEDISEL